MRIIAGHIKGHKLASVQGSLTRPTADCVRESLFNILGSAPQQAMVLDLFAGTGALGIEALSRGAQKAVFVDHSIQAITVLRKNIENCNLQTYTQIFRWDILKNLNCLKSYIKTFNLVFLDPPYSRQMLLPTLKHLELSSALTIDALIVAEHAHDEKIDTQQLNFSCTDQRRYGRTWISFFHYHTG